MWQSSCLQTDRSSANQDILRLLYISKVTIHFKNAFLLGNRSQNVPLPQVLLSEVLLTVSYRFFAVWLSISFHLVLACTVLNTGRITLDQLCRESQMVNI